tara:strand:- start:134 stop:1180 length:1047 start_codon:yes stop_codon:yes gene_type:complete
MDHARREYLVAKICAGYLRCQIGEGICLRIEHLRVHQNYIAQDIYSSAYDKAVEENLYFDEEVVEWMKEQGFWSDTDDKRLEKIPIDIDDTKVSMFEAQFNKSKQDSLRIFLRKAEEQLFRTLQKRHRYDHLTCSGYANYARLNWMIENCTYYEDGKPYDFVHKSISEVLAEWQSSGITESEYRELAKEEPWRGIWSASKNGGVLFDRMVCEYTTQQKTLMAWTRMYDAISESPNAPGESVVEDDDLVDGWLIKQRRDKEVADGQKGTEQLFSDKVANSGEIFIVTGSEKDDVERVNKLNDPISKQAKKSRFSVLKEGGTIDEANLPDVRQDLKMQGHRQFKDSLKGS